jgi:transcription antitermination factor NusG
MSAIAVGDEVVILEGGIESLTGIIIALDRMNAEVEIEIYGRKTAVSIPIDTLKKTGDP